MGKRVAGGLEQEDWGLGRVSKGLGPNRVQESALFMNINVGGLKSYLFHVRKTMKVVSRP